MIELGICDRDHMGYKSKIFTIQTFMEKKLPTTDLNFEWEFSSNKA